MSPCASTMCSQSGRGVEMRRCTSASGPGAVAGLAETATHHAGPRRGAAAARAAQALRGDSRARFTRIRAAQRNAVTDRIRTATERVVVPAVQHRVVAARVRIALTLVDNASLSI